MLYEETGDKVLLITKGPAHPQYWCLLCLEKTVGNSQDPNLCPKDKLNHQRCTTMTY